MANVMRLGGGGGGKPKKLLSSLTEGSLVSVLEDGKLTPFYVAKHNYEADLNGEGRTLLVRKDIHSNRVWDAGNVNKYDGSDVDIWFNGEYLSMLSGVVKGSVATTRFYNMVGNNDTTIATLAKAVFALSWAEIGFTATSYASMEGSALPVASSLKIAYLNGVAALQALRTPQKGTTTNILYSDANASGAGTPSNGQVGIRPCFTLPANMALNTEPYGDGSWVLADEDVLFDTETASTTAKAGVNYTNGIADLTPAQLHEIAKAISSNPNITKGSSVVYYDNGSVHLKISVGDKHNTTYLNNAFTASVIGFNHDDLSNGLAYNVPTATGKAGITFQFTDCIAQTYSMNAGGTNSGGWASSAMRNNTFPLCLSRLSADVVSAIKPVNKLTSAGNKSATITATEDKLFLLAEIEVFGAITYSYAGEGSQYAYYKAGNSKIKKLNGSAQNWFERSPRHSSTNYFCYVDSNGNANETASNNSLGVAFAYCI